MRYIATVLILFLAVSASAEEIKVGTLNTESGSDTQPFMVAQLIRKIGRIDVWAFQEVASVNAAIEYTVAAGAAGGRKSYRYVVSESGEINAPHRQHDLLAIVYNSSRLRQVETVELHGIRSRPGSGRLGETSWGLRGALLLRLQDRDTGNEFYVGNVHLKCCGGSGPATRAHQAQIIHDWVQQSDVPVIFVGDFNIPVDPASANGNQNSDAFTTLEQAMTWLRPSNPIKTQCSPSFNSMLDHVFFKDGPKITAQGVQVKETQAEYCQLDGEGFPDHRPLVATFDLTQ